MAEIVSPFSDEQARTIVNLRQRYDVWIEAERTLSELPYDLRRKEVGERAYLYEIADRSGNGKSLGPWTSETEARFNAYRAQKADAKTRRDTSRAALEETCRLYRALRLPMLASEAGPILREADRRRLLGSHLLVVGTNAMAVYSLEAGGLINDVPDETQDFDMAWSASETSEDAQSLWHMLKAVDPTFTVNTERTFQARNAAAYEVEILVAPSRLATMSRTDRPQPVPLPEQEWLLEGRTVDHIVVCRDNSPARIVAPDPRWFALQKLWMAEQSKRNPLKRPKDLKQGLALLDAVSLTMPQYPLDEAFAAALPDDLSELFSRWAARRPLAKPPSW
jgi:hypothetical protein